MQRNADLLYSVDAELSVLGGIFIQSDKLDELASVLTDDLFSSPNNREVYRAMRTIHAEGIALDPVTVTERLRDWGSLDRIGGVPFFSELMEAVPTAANIGYHAAILRSKAHLRTLRQIGTTIGELVLTGKPAEEVQEEAERLIYGAGDGLQLVDVQLEHVRKGMMAAIARLERNEPDVLTGFQSIDWHTQGFAKGDLVILAARPSMGKTALMLQIAVNAAAAKMGNVAVFSLEMTTEAICRRLLFTEARVDASNFRRHGGADEDESARVGNAASLLNSIPLYITDRASTVTQVRGQLRRLRKQSGEPIRMVAIDYLGKMRGSGKTENRTHEIGEITGDLKALAIEFDCPVVLLCQLSRAVETRNDKRPVLSDLRDSGEIEQDADTVLMLYRPEYYEGPVDAKGNTLEGKAEVIVAKQRNGKTGRINLQFRGQFTRFEDAPE